MHPAFPDLKIMKQSILSVHLVDARELRPTFGNPVHAQVRTSIEGNRDSTKDTVASNNPVWNEVMTFDIERGDDFLKVQVLDVEQSGVEKRREVIGEVEIDLRNLSYAQQQWMMDNPGKFN